MNISHVLIPDQVSPTEIPIPLNDLERLVDGQRRRAPVATLLLLSRGTSDRAA